MLDRLADSTRLGQLLRQIMKETDPARCYSGPLERRKDLIESDVVRGAYRRSYSGRPRSAMNVFGGYTNDSERMCRLLIRAGSLN